MDPENREAFDLWLEIEDVALDGFGGAQFAAIEFVLNEFGPRAPWERREITRKLIACVAAQREYALKKAK